MPSLMEEVLNKIARIQRVMETMAEKNLRKKKIYIYIYICITESLCCVLETNATLEIKCISIKKIKTKKTQSDWRTPSFILNMSACTGLPSKLMAETERGFSCTGALSCQLSQNYVKNSANRFHVYSSLMFLFNSADKCVFSTLIMQH